MTANRFDHCRDMTGLLIAFAGHAQALVETTGDDEALGQDTRALVAEYLNARDRVMREAGER